MELKGRKKVELIRAISEKIESLKWNEREQACFFQDHKIKPRPERDEMGNWYKSIGITETLVENKDNDKFANIARELEIDTNIETFKGIALPNYWKDTKDFRLFISHISEHQNIAKGIKDYLTQYNILAFVAHVDIEPAELWQKEIEKALNNMDAMLAINKKGFKDSHWTQQEIGYAIGRNVKIISLKYDEPPIGFIGKEQAILRDMKNRKHYEVAESIRDLLLKDIRTKEKMKEAQKSNDILDDVPF